MVRTIAFLTVLTGLLAGQADAQFLFMDTDNDQISTNFDQLSRVGNTVVDVWLVTNANRDGSEARATSPRGALTLSSYEIILHADGGTVEWGEYTNSQPSMSLSFGSYRNDTDMYAGFGGVARLAPGRYKLGSVPVKVKTGSPTLRFATSTPLGAVLQTSFGSRNPGKEGDHTLRLGPDVGAVLASGARADWTDASGVQTENLVWNAAEAPEEAAPLRFGVEVVRSGYGGQLAFRVNTTSESSIRITLFDVHGRVVARVGEEDAVAAGSRLFEVHHGRAGVGRLSSGIYFYEARAEGRIVRGKVALVK